MWYITDRKGESNVLNSNPGTMLSRMQTWRELQENEKQNSKRKSANATIRFRINRIWQRISQKQFIYSMYMWDPDRRSIVRTSLVTEGATQSQASAWGSGPKGMDNGCVLDIRTGTKALVRFSRKWGKQMMLDNKSEQKWPSVVSRTTEGHFFLFLFG